MLSKMNKEEDAIILNDPRIVSFFKEKENELFEPNLFFLSLIKQYNQTKLSPPPPPPPPPPSPPPQPPNDKIELNKKELETFYEEYTFFLNQRNTIIDILKDNQKECQSNLNRIKFIHLENFFAKHVNIKKKQFVCDLCGVFCVSTHKGLVAHKRKCSEK